MYLINTFLGFLIAQLYDILRRNKASETSPVPFDLVFFFKDTWQKIAISVLLSFSISVAIHLNYPYVETLIGKEVSPDILPLIYIPVGAVPELVLQYFKKKAGFLQPQNVSGYARK